ncbi:uncharacterized protein LOC117220344 isoform X4 [Megalopta genalis]|uniref:uncharacterized protein LOC117220344 isoform X4 n=1 Tax=Megalopta genalis TaxID=115081 RepID=UPI003FD32227
MYFPPEIWEHIFLYVDAVTLTNLKLVCNSWNEIINKMLKKNNHWFKACERDIPEYLWSTFCESLNPTRYYTEFHEKCDSEMWMALYKLWITCKNVMRWNLDAKFIEPLRADNSTEQITCIGTSETCTVCVCRSPNNHISMWDVTEKMLIEKKRGELICTSYSYCYTAVRNMIIVEGPIPKTIYEFNTTKVIAIGADNDKVHLYTREHFVHLNLDGGSKKYVTWTLAEPPNTRIRRFYIFKPDRVVCIAENGYLGFLVKGEEWEMHNLLPILHATPTTVLVYGHVLFVGVDSGNVHAFYIDDFEAINFNTIDSKQLTLEYTAVVSLNILAHIESYLIVSYTKKVYLVQLN